MVRKQLIALFLCSLIVWTVGNGLLPLLPLYAAHLGATPAAVGYYMSIIYVAVASGTFAAGWLSDRFQRRKALLVLSGAVAIPAVWLMGRATDLWQLAALTATAWFLGGIALTTAGILTGLFAREEERGRVFGILALTGALGALVGGMVTGPVVDRWGYPSMFAVLARCMCVSPLAALLVEDKRIVQRANGTSPSRERSGLGRSFYLLLLASLAVAAGYFVSVSPRSLVMHEMGFDASAISSTVALAGAINLPLPLLFGWLSDRVGRKPVLVLGYALGTVGLLAFTASAALWHFWAAVSLTYVPMSLASVGSAMVTDLVRQESLGRGMSLFNATTWIGAIIAFAATGNVIQALGMTATFAIGAALPLIAIVLLIPIRQPVPEPA